MAKKKTSSRGGTSSRSPSAKPRRKSAANGSARAAGKPTKGASPKGKPAKAGGKASPAKKSGRKKPTKADDGRQRLQRVMAAAGVASRRECEIIIQEGRVEVDGKVVAELGVKVDPSKQEIYVDAQRIRIEPLQYFMLNKPQGILSTSQDPSGRPRVIDLIKTNNRVYNVGRLDQSSEGLILVTNDGTLAHRLTHPRYGIEKKYHVQVDGRPTPDQLRQLRDGVYIAEGKVRASNIRYLKRANSGSWLEIILDEGRNREIRRMLAAIGHKVRVLKRVSIGPLKLGELPIGAHRPLTAQEIKKLEVATSSGVKAKKRRPVKRTGEVRMASEVRTESKKKDTKSKSTSRGPVTPRGSRRHSIRPKTAKKKSSKRRRK